MRIVWVTNLPIGPLAKHMNIAESSGSWIYASLKEVMLPNNSVFVITTCSISERIELEENGVKYIALPTGNPSAFKICEENESVWKTELNSISPDILQVWGTEYKHVTTALNSVDTRCRKLIYIQGVMRSIYQYYYGGISKGTLIKYTSPMELILGKSLFSARKETLCSANLEENNIAIADGIILETKWSENYYCMKMSDIAIYHHKLPINSAFRNEKWDINNIRRHSIFAPASDYPLKGLHYLVQAIRYVKRKCLDVMLYVPGAIVKKDISLKESVKQKAYRKYIRSLITEYDLWDNITFVGVLHANEMAHHMATANVFVCASVIENHSSTLREAMMVGAPCISTCVGGIPEYLINGYNGLFYNTSDSISLAGSILKVFNSDKIAMDLSNNARLSIEQYYSYKSSSLQDIYLSIKNNNEY